MSNRSCCSLMKHTVAIVMHSSVNIKGEGSFSIRCSEHGELLQGEHSRAQAAV